MAPGRSPLSYTDDGRGEPVVFLHAFPLDGRMWREERNLLRGHRVIVPDLAGFGGSRGVPPRTSLDAHAGDVATLLDDLGIERATLVGLSMGGYIALAFAGRHPRRLARLVLADTKSTPDTAEGKALRDQNIALVASEGVGALVARLVPKLLSKNASSDVVDFVRSVAAAQPPASVKAALAAMRDRADTTPLLAGIDVPAAIVVGEEDVITPVADARGMSTRLPRADLEILPRAGHLANLESGTLFVAAVSRLLAR